MTWLWAVRDLWRRPVRTSLSLAGIAVASALLIDMMMLSGGLERSFAELLMSRGFQLRITPKGTLPFDTEATIIGADSIVQILRADREVAEAGALLATSAFVRRGTELVPVVAYGVDPTSQGFYTLTSGRDLRSVSDSVVLVGAAAARLLGATNSDTLELVGALDPQVASPATSSRLVVAGEARFIYDAREQPSVAIPLDQARRLTGRAGEVRASMIMVRIREGFDVAAATARLQERLPAVTVGSVDDLVSQFRLRLTYFRQLSLILGTIALAVTILLIGTLLAITVNEQIGDIAMLRAIGVSRRSIVGRVLAQGAALTLAGGAGGMCVGLVTARWLDGILTSFPGLPAAISFFVADPDAVARAAATITVTGILAGVPAAWHAARAPVALALRSDAT